jgi:NAD(P)-dependent dehydrogenase (short-subunit alcohol dehydrogenase family)
MTQMLALELAKHRIRVNVVCPGKIETEIEESTTHRSSEEAEVPAEYPEGNIPLTGEEPGRATRSPNWCCSWSRIGHDTSPARPVWIDGGQSLLV